MSRRGRLAPVILIPAICLLLVGLAVAARGSGQATLQLPSTARIYEALAETVAVLILAMGLLTLAVSIWVVPRAAPGSGKRRRRSWASIFITIGLMYVVVAVLLRLRPGLLAHPGGTAGVAAAAHHSAGGAAQLSLGDWLGFALGAAIVLLIGLVAAWRIFRRTGSAVVAPADAVVEGVDAGLEELRSIRDARSAVIRAYAAMERVFARRGLGRKPHEAPTEYLARLVPGSADRGEAASRLTRLYQLARFSSHPVPADMKQQAIAALEAMRSTST